MKRLVAGNWKMNGSLSLVMQFNEAFKGYSGGDLIDIVIAPPLPFIPILSNADGLQKGAQTCHSEADGAYTGEVSAEILREVKVEWVILGHSERRHGNVHANDSSGMCESEGGLEKRLRQALSAGLKVIWCVGETMAERDSDKTLEVISRQLQSVLKLNAQSKDIVIAYEPVWAIGTGQTATPQQAQQIHVEIRRLLGANGTETRIIYGGSVNAVNARELLQMPDIWGFLVGKASLSPSEFKSICDICLQ